MAFELDPNYKQVPERIKDFKEKHPEGNLEPVDKTRPYWFERLQVIVEKDDGSSVEVTRTYLVYAAAAYRSPRDEHPGIGLAWEKFPGTTPYTKDSELQNAETSAWGRAIVAALASESKSIASAEDVRNREAERSNIEQWQQFGYAGAEDFVQTHDRVVALWAQLDGEALADIRKWLKSQKIERRWPLPLDIAEALFARAKASVEQSAEPPSPAAQPAVAAPEAPSAPSEPPPPPGEAVASLGEALHEVAGQLAGQSPPAAAPEPSAPPAAEPEAPKTARAPSARDLERIAGSPEAAQAVLDRATREVAILSTAGISGELGRRKLSKDGTVDERKRRLAAAMAAEEAEKLAVAGVTPISAGGAELTDKIAAASSASFRSPAPPVDEGEDEHEFSDAEAAALAAGRDEALAEHAANELEGEPDSRPLDEAGQPVASDEEAW